MHGIPIVPKLYRWGGITSHVNGFGICEPDLKSLEMFFLVTLDHTLFPTPPAPKHATPTNVCPPALKHTLLERLT